MMKLKDLKVKYLKLISLFSLMDDLPIELIENIYDHVCKNNDAIFCYKLRSLNSAFLKVVDNYKKGFKRVYFPDKLFQRAQYPVFKWFFRNHLYFDYNDLIKLILHNRCDILKKSIEYKTNRNIIFTRRNVFDMRFYFTSFNIFNLQGVSTSLILYACECNRLDIVKFLLETDHGSCYSSQISNAVRVCITKRYVEILNYLCVNYINYIRNHSVFIPFCISVLETEFTDTLVYLLDNHKINISDSIRNQLIISDIDDNRLERYL